MKVQELGVEEMARFGATHRVIITAPDLNGTGTGFGALSAAAAASTAGTLKPFATLAAGKQVQFVAGYLPTPFTAGTATNLTIGIGYDLGAGTDKAAGLETAVELMGSATEIVFFPQEIGDVSATSVDETYGTVESAALVAAIAAINELIKRINKVWNDTDALGLVFTSTAANLSDLLTGELHLLFRVADLTKI